MIYLLEDDDSIRELVVYTLNNQQLEAEGFGLPSDFWHAMERRMPDLVLLDLMLPEEDGISILRKLRAKPETACLPIILLTAKSSEYDTVYGLDQGADDYIAKPFRTMELLSRVRALMRRAGAGRQNGEYQNGPLTVRPGQRIAEVEGIPVALTRKEFELLLLLISRPGMVFSRSQILDQIWGYEFDGENRTVDVHVRTLRQKLGKAGDLIETVRGVGYRIGGAK